ncbi:hypothetical protein QK297_28235 [Pseudomonas sp. AL15]|nr:MULTISPECIES: hypothetical protein [Pseudomonas]MDI3252978.1 hypothetical protein [Pseudomonas sp. AL10]MDI3268897.1 hypothetical protein [Pseudomonas sp. AL15]
MADRSESAGGVPGRLNTGCHRNRIKNVGAGLLANAVNQPGNCWLTHCIREQARSHICLV